MAPRGGPSSLRNLRMISGLAAEQASNAEKGKLPRPFILQKYTKSLSVDFDYSPEIKLNYIYN